MTKPPPRWPPTAFQIPDNPPNFGHKGTGVRELLRLPHAPQNILNNLKTHTKNNNGKRFLKSEGPKCKTKGEHPLTNSKNLHPLKGLEEKLICQIAQHSIGTSSPSHCIAKGEEVACVNTLPLTSAVAALPKGLPVTTVKPICGSGVHMRRRTTRSIVFHLGIAGGLDSGKIRQ